MDAGGDDKVEGAAPGRVSGGTWLTAVVGYTCDTELEESEQRCPPCLASLARKYLIWECCPTWVKLKTLLFRIVTDPFAELTITLCIVVNTVFMAMEHHGMSSTFETMFQTGNIVSVLAAGAHAVTAGAGWWQRALVGGAVGQARREQLSSRAEMCGP